MNKNKEHHFGTTTLGKWDDREVQKGGKPLHNEPQTTETAPIRRADSLVYEDVWESLYQAAEVDAGEIEVRVSEGSVILKGFTNSRLARRTATQIIRDIAGVLEVKNDLWIRNPIGLISPEEDDRFEVRTTRGLVNNHTGLS